MDYNSAYNQNQPFSNISPQSGDGGYDQTMMPMNSQFPDQNFLPQQQQFIDPSMQQVPQYPMMDPNMMMMSNPYMYSGAGMMPMMIQNPSMMMMQQLPQQDFNQQEGEEDDDEGNDQYNPDQLAQNMVNNEDLQGLPLLNPNVIKSAAAKKTKEKLKKQREQQILEALEYQTELLFDISNKYKQKSEKDEKMYMDKIRQLELEKEELLLQAKTEEMVNERVAKKLQQLKRLGFFVNPYAASSDPFYMPNSHQFPMNPTLTTEQNPNDDGEDYSMPKSSKKKKKSKKKKA